MILDTLYYTKSDLIQFSTPLSSQQNTMDTAYTGINKYILYSDASLTKPVGQVLYTATVYNLVTSSQTTTYNPYKITLFFNTGINVYVSANGAHDDSKNTFFPIGVIERATVSDQKGFKQKIQYINIEALDRNLRKIQLISNRCGC